MLNFINIVNANFNTSVYCEMTISDDKYIVKISNGDEIILVNEKGDELSPMAFFYKRKMMLENGGREYKFSYTPSK